jgi:hypothetical protein
MDHPDTPSDFAIIDLWCTRILHPCKNVYFETAPPQFFAHLAYVHIHTARFFSTQGGDRAGVYTQHRNT